MIRFTSADIPDDSLNSPHIYIGDLFGTNIPQKVLQEYQKGREDIGIDEIICILRRVIEGNSITQGEFIKLQESIFTAQFYKFYKTRLSYKEGVSGILLDGSVNCNAKKLQNTIDTIGLKESIVYQKSKISTIQGLLADTELGKHLKFKGGTYMREKVPLRYGDKKFQEEKLCFKKYYGSISQWTSIRTGENYFIHEEKGCISSGSGIKEITPFGEFIVLSDNSVIHTPSGVRVSTGREEIDVVEGTKGYGGILVGNKTLYLFGKKGIERKINVQEPSIHDARSGRKREGDLYIYRISCNVDYKSFEIGYSKAYLYRESDFTNEDDKREFRNARRREGWRDYHEEQGITYQIIGEKVEIIQI